MKLEAIATSQESGATTSVIVSRQNCLDFSGSNSGVTTPPGEDDETGPGARSGVLYSGPRVPALSGSSTPLAGYPYDVVALGTPYSRSGSEIDASQRSFADTCIPALPGTLGPAYSTAYSGPGEPGDAVAPLGPAYLNPACDSLYSRDFGPTSRFAVETSTRGQVDFATPSSKLYPAVVEAISCRGATSVDAMPAEILPPPLISPSAVFRGFDECSSTDVFSGSVSSARCPYKTMASLSPDENASRDYELPTTSLHLPQVSTFRISHYGAFTN